jgi:hypothetical protein
MIAFVFPDSITDQLFGHRETVANEFHENHCPAITSSSFLLLTRRLKRGEAILQHTRKSQEGPNRLAGTNQGILGPVKCPLEYANVLTVQYAKLY